MNFRKLTALAMAFALAVLVLPLFSAADGTDAADTSGNTYGVSMVEGSAYSYKPTYSISGVTTTLSGTASSWLTVSNGTISGNAPAVTASGGSVNYELTITASTVNPVQSAVQHINFTVFDTLTVSAPANETTYVGDTSVSVQASSNYSTGMTWSMTGAPSGLSISSAGLITGTVGGSAGTYTATVTGTHTASGQTRTATVSFTVTAVLAVTSGSNMYAVNGVVLPSAGQDNYYAVTANLAGTVFTATGLPSGVSMSTAGVFTGTPTAMGSSSVTVTASHAASGQTATFTLTMNFVAKLSFSSVPTGGIVVNPN